LLTIAVSKIKNIPGAKADIDLCADVDPLAYGYQDLEFSSPVHFIGEMGNKNGLIFVSGRASAGMKFCCHRCGEPFTKDIQALVEAYYTLQPEKADPQGEYDIFTYSGETIDITPEVLRQIFLEVPMKLLCCEDCRGLCPICGANLNYNKCSCRVEQIDPRLEKLKDFVFDTEKGV
jgi:uncharacterized protein